MLVGAHAEVPRITNDGTIALTSWTLNIETRSDGDVEKSWFLGRNFDKNPNIEP
jgi:hypothetical protein